MQLELGRRINVSLTVKYLYVHARIQKGWGPEGAGTEGRDPLLKNHKHIEFLSNSGPDPMKNHKATKPAIQFWAIISFLWRADDGRLIVVFGSFLPHQTKKEKKTKKKNVIKVGPPRTKLSGTWGMMLCTYVNMIVWT